MSLVFTGIPWRTTWKYGPRGYRHLFWDAGAMVANALAAAASAGWQAEVLVGFVDEALEDLLALHAQPFRELPLAVVRLGPRLAGVSAELPPERKLPPVDHEVPPLSQQARSYDGVAAVHDAGELHAPEEVPRWRSGLAGAEHPDARTGGSAPPDADGTVTEVILRRGSTRRFDTDVEAPGAALRWGLTAALHEVPGDLAPVGRIPLRAAVAVHSVSGITAGLHLSDHGGLRRIAEADRRRTAAMCLDQSLGGTSAFTSFFGCDLDRLLSGGGARAYRSAELAAGIAAERLQLAAFGLGLGGTGLTFFDDEVRDTTGLEPLLVTAIGAPDYEPTPGRRPGSEDR